MNIAKQWIVIALPVVGIFVIGWFKSSSPDDGFEQTMRQWTENAKTNLTEETSARFRDEVVIPFLKREMPNPFLPGGAESDKPWAEEATKVYEAGLRDVCDGNGALWYLNHRNCKQAAELYNRGCREPFISMLSAFDPMLSWHLDAKISLERLAAAEKVFSQNPKVGFLRILHSFFRSRLGHGSEEETKKHFKSWIREKGFTKEDEVAIYRLHTTFFGWSVDILDSFPSFSWSSALMAANKAHAEAVDVAGRGIPASISKKGWMMLNDRHRAAVDILDEAERERPGRVETLYERLWIDGDSRMGNREFRQRIFNDMSAKRLDDAKAIVSYVWFNLYPRWGGDRGRRRMRRFAKACYETQRHDTVLPYFYAEIMCRYVRDAAIDPCEYFRSHSNVVDKCIDVCMRQATNELACGYARLHAPFVGAAVAYYAGRYEKAAEFSPYFYMLPDELDQIFFDKSDIAHAIHAFAVDYSELCLKLQRLYDDGRYAELLDEVAKVTKDVYEDYPTKQFICSLAFNARMKYDFPEGRDVKAEVLSYFPGWWDEGWWRTNDKTWQTWQPFSWKNHVTWRARIPRDHELELVLSPKPKTNGRHVLVVSRCVYEETHHLPINKIPFVTFIWEKDCTKVYVDNNYYRMFTIDPKGAKSKASQCDRRKIRIVCDDGKLDIYVDGGYSPVLSTSDHVAAIKRGPEFGLVRFHSADVTISDITVRSVGKRTVAEGEAKDEGSSAGIR